MRGYKDGGLVKKRRKLPSGATAPPYIPPTTKGALGMSGAMGGALGIGSALGASQSRSLLGNIGTLARDRRVYSNKRIK